MRSIFFLISILVISFSWANTYQQRRHEHFNFNEALRIGVDVDGKALFLCQVNFLHGIQPGKTWPGAKFCLIAFGGKEYFVESFIIPNRNSFRQTSGNIHSHRSVVIGHEANGTPLLLCQALFHGRQLPGKTWAGYKHCNISYEGREIVLNNYRTLPSNFFETNVETVNIHPSQALEVHRHQMPAVHQHF